MTHKFMLAGLLFFILATTSFADPAFTINKTVVRSAPEAQAQQLAILTAGESVDLKTRQGGWYQIVFHDSQLGWLPLLSVRKDGAAPKHKKKSGLKSLLSTYRTGSSDVTVATGVRGLDAVDLKNSKPNMAELEKIAKYVSSDEEARAYAVQDSLVSRNIAWIQASDKE